MHFHQVGLEPSTCSEDTFGYFFGLDRQVDTRPLHVCGSVDLQRIDLPLK